MNAADYLTERFEQQRGHLRAVAYRMLGSLTEADDAVQDTWLRVTRAGADDVDNLTGWFTTVLARVCLNQLRSRSRRREDPLDHHVPDPVVTAAENPEHAALMADSVSLALLVVLDTLAPAERLAFVLHDLFDVPYGDIAELVGRTPDATKQLASRARRRVKGSDPEAGHGTDRERQRSVVDAFFRATRDGDLATLVTLLDPDVVLRIDAGNRAAASMALRGGEAVAAQTVRGLASALARPHIELRPVTVNGTPGVLATAHGRPVAVVGFLFRDGRITEIDSLADPDRLGRLTA